VARSTFFISLARFTVPVPEGLAVAGYRYRLRVTEPGRD
jgi:hypothetical protein